MKNSILPLLLLFASCDELVTTQVDPPKITLEREFMPADGESTIQISVRMKRASSATTKLTITTSNGKLFSLPKTSGSAGSDSIVLTPKSTEASVLLVSSLNEDGNVIVSATVNGLITTKKMRFRRSCPDEVQARLKKQTISLEGDDSVKFDLTFLRSDLKNVTLETRVDCSISPPDLAVVDKTIYSNEHGKTFTYLKPLKTGEGNLILELNGSCGSVSIDTVKFAVVE